MLPVEQWEPSLVDLLDARHKKSAELGLMRIFAHRPEAAKAFAGFAAASASGGTLPARLIELVRLRIAFHNQCRTCMSVRYQAGVDDGVDEALVCSLEKPAEADALTSAEKSALQFADRFATDHLSIDDATIDDLRKHFSEAEIVELGMFVASSVGFGRLAAVFNMLEDLPDEYQGDGRLAPWAVPPVRTGK